VGGGFKKKCKLSQKASTCMSYPSDLHMKMPLLILLLLMALPLCAQTDTTSAVYLVDAQLKAYNSRNLEAFLAPYSDTVKVYLAPNKLMYQGKKRMLDSYEYLFKAYPDLNCRVINRMLEGNVVIDQERVFLAKDAPLVEAIAVYRVHSGKITEVMFIYKDMPAASTPKK
jgi:hypothetical protein